MTYEKKPMKFAEKLLRGYGATRDREDRYGVTYLMPCGSREFVPHNVNSGKVRTYAARWAERYGKRAAPRTGGPNLVDVPIKLTDHAADRVTLMHQQAGVTKQEIVQALLHPDEVVQTDKGWNWVGERITVIGAIHSGALLIATVIWSTPELFARYPRPEKA